MLENDGDNSRLDSLSVRPAAIDTTAVNMTDPDFNDNYKMAKPLATDASVGVPPLSFTSFSDQLACSAKVEEHGKNDEIPPLGSYERLQHMVEHGQMISRDHRGHPRITEEGRQAILHYAETGPTNLHSFNPFAGFDGTNQRLRYAANLINDGHNLRGNHRVSFAYSPPRPNTSEHGSIIVTTNRGLSHH